MATTKKKTTKKRVSAKQKAAQHSRFGLYGIVVFTALSLFFLTLTIVKFV